MPYSTAAFTGRADELARIGALLTETTAHRPVVISAIDGTGGAGKSALAIRVAHELVDRFPDGQLYVDLCGATVGLPPLEPHEDPMAARAFRLMGSLNGVDVDAPTVAAGLDEPPAVAEVALERLVECRLVQASADGRCTLHDLLRLFARERAQDEECDSERAVLLERVLRYYLANAQLAVTLLDSLRQWPRHPVETSVTVSFDDRAAAEGWLEAERTNMVEAVVSGAEQSDQLPRFAIGLSQALHWFLMPHGYSSDQHVVQAAEHQAMLG